MSLEAEFDAVPTMECRVCQTEVPAGGVLRSVRRAPDPGARGRPAVVAPRHLRCRAGRVAVAPVDR